MSSYSAPPPPDYAASTTAGVKADADTLPFRLAVSQAAQQGKIYKDPATGKVYDFTGLGYQEQNKAAFDSNVDLMRKGSEISLENERKRLQSELELLPQFNKLNLDQQKAAVDLALKSSADYTKNTYDQNLEYQPKFGDLQRRENEKSFDQNLALGRKGTFEQADWQKQLLPELNALSRDEQGKTYDASLAADARGFAQRLGQADDAAGRAAKQQESLLPGLNRLGIANQREAYQAGIADNEETFDRTIGQINRAGKSAAQLQEELTPGLNKLLLRNQGEARDAALESLKKTDPTGYNNRETLGKSIASELAMGSDMTAAQKRNYTEKVRGAQAARGNILGDSAGFDEALKLTGYGDDLQTKRQGAALSFLNSKDLMPSFRSLDVINPTQVAAPNLGPASYGAVPVGNPTQTVAPLANAASFSTTQAVNPLMPNFGATQALNPNVPNLTATTTGGPNLNATPIQTMNPMQFINPNAGDNAASFNQGVWGQQFSRESKQVNPWMAGLGMLGQGVGVATGVKGLFG